MFTQRFQELASAIQSVLYTTAQRPLSEKEAFEEFLQLLIQTRDQKGIVYVIGNGGSAGIASHFSTDLMKTLKVPSLTLFDSNLMTCLSNDWGYENVFSYPLSQVLKEQDLLITISSSGKSPNIIQAAKTALDKKTPLITLSGFSDKNPLREMGKLNLWVERSDYGLVEIAHSFLLHTVIDLWNHNPFLKNEHAQACPL